MLTGGGLRHPRAPIKDQIHPHARNVRGRVHHGQAPIGCRDHLLLHLGQVLRADLLLHTRLPLRVPGMTCLLCSSVCVCVGHVPFVCVGHVPFVCVLVTRACLWFCPSLTSRCGVKAHFPYARLFVLSSQG